MTLAVAKLTPLRLASTGTPGMGRGKRLRSDTRTVGPGQVEQHTVEVAAQHLVSGVARGKFFDAWTGTAPPDRVARAPHEPLAVHDAGGSDAIENLARARWQGLREPG